jgi:hypothetical protein
MVYEGRPGLRPVSIGETYHTRYGHQCNPSVMEVWSVSSTLYNAFLKGNSSAMGGTPQKKGALGLVLRVTNFQVV